MSRLQKKCLVGSAFAHGLLWVLVFIGSAFIPSKPKENFIPIDLIDLNATLVDEPNVVGGGNPNASLPPPVAAPKVQPQPAAPQPSPLAQTTPKQEPKPEPIKEKEPPHKEPAPVEKIPEPKPDKKFQLDPDSFKVFDKATKEKPAKPEQTFDFSKAQKRVIKPSTLTGKDPAEEEIDARAAREAKLAQARAGALNEVMSRLQGGLSKGVGEIGVPGPGGRAYASYGLYLRKTYEEAWIPPTAARGDEPTVGVEVVIRRDGTVLSRRITRKSGRAELDRTVQKALDRVNKVRPFPSEGTDEQRKFEFDFNLTDKQG
ncbi:MAG TPA: TonB family protein [Verrucomicrobiae bacterium]|jgi:colicin import membrane protein|nr:TonB family protein [Verrucomicrobiae bacterium]